MVNILDNFDTDPNMYFNNGKVVNGVAQFDADPSNLAGGVNTDWDITQWSSNTYFNPTSYTVGLLSDPILGSSLATWSEGNGNDSGGDASLSIYKSTATELPGYTYALQTQGGTLNDVNLSSHKNFGTNYTFNHQINFNVNERLTNVYGGSGLMQMSNSYTVNFNVVKKIAGVPQLGIFLQFGLADSRGTSFLRSGYSTLQGASSGGKIFMPGNVASVDGLNITYNNDMDFLDYDDQTNFSKVSINLNAGLDKMISELSAEDPTNAKYYQDLSNWNLTGTYTGQESGSLGSPSAVNQSAVLDVNDPELTYGDASNVTYDASNQKIQTITPMSTTHTDVTIQNGATETLNVGTATSTFLSLGGSLSVSGSSDVTAVGTYQNLTMSGSGTESVSAQLNGVASLNSVSGNIGITGVAGSIINASNSSVSVQESGGSLFKTGSGNVTVYGSLDQFSVSGGTNNTIQASLTGSGYLGYAIGTMGLTLGSTSNLTVDGSYVYTTMNGGSLTLNNGASANITGTDAAESGAYVNANGGQINYDATSNANLTIHLGHGKAIETYGSGYTNTIVNMQNDVDADISNFKASNGEILATNLTKLNDVQIDYSNNRAFIHEAGHSGGITLENIQPGSVSLMTALNGVDFSQQQGSNTILIALNQNS